MKTPIGEVLGRRKHTPAVAERIRRLNPDGVDEGAIPYGWNPQFRFYPIQYDVMPVRRFIEKYGRDAYRSLPKWAVWRRGHKKAIAGRAIRVLFK